jgi:hypothetical protein
MELVVLLKTLWQRRWWTLGAFALALLAAASVRFEISPSGFADRAVHFGVASREVLLDAPSSTLGDLGRDIEPLTARGSVFARVLTSEGVVKDIGRHAGIRAARIAVQGPPLVVQGIPDAANEERSKALAGSNPYQVTVLRGDDLPVLTVFTRAPTAGEARRLANGTTRALVELVDRAQAQAAVPESRRLTIRVLGPATAREAVDQPSALLALAAFIGVFGLGCVAILVGPGLVAALRAEEVARPLAPAGTSPNGNGDMHDLADRGGWIDLRREAFRQRGNEFAPDRDSRSAGDAERGGLARRRDT